jgi:hypothetical protein
VSYTSTQSNIKPHKTARSQIETTSAEITAPIFNRSPQKSPKNISVNLRASPLFRYIADTDSGTTKPHSEGEGMRLNLYQSSALFTVPEAAQAAIIPIRTLHHWIAAQYAKDSNQHTRLTAGSSGQLLVVSPLHTSD